MTKQEERAALAKIEKLINEAGPDSYIGLTFAGMIETARDNIENDFATNYKELYIARTEDLQDARKQLENTKIELANTINACREHMQETADADERYKAEHHENLETAGKLNQTVKKLETANETIKGLQAEIVTLKAKLYDLVTK